MGEEGIEKYNKMLKNLANDKQEKIDVLRDNRMEFNSTATE